MSIHRIRRINESEKFYNLDETFEKTIYKTLRNMTDYNFIPK